MPTEKRLRQGLRNQSTAFLKQTALDIILEILVGPIVAASAIYTMATRRDGRSPSFYGAINFSLSRYGRLFKWHAAAWLSIRLGMIIVIPGVLFMMMYAMVDPLLCFEKERWPLDRSKKLTRARRKTLFFFLLPWFLITAPIPLALLMWAPSQGAMMTLAVAVFYYLCLFWLHAGFGWTYLERLDAGRKAAEAAREADSDSTGKDEDEDEDEAGESQTQDATPDPVVIAARTSGAGTVQPMGLGQKLGLMLIGLIGLGILYSVFSDDEPTAVNPTSLDGSFAPSDGSESSTEPASSTSTTTPE